VADHSGSPELTSLEQQRAILEKAQDVAHIGSWAIELDGSNRLNASAEAFRIFDIPPSNFDGTGRPFRAKVHPADREMVQNATQRAFQERRVYEIEYRIIRPDGVRWIHEKGDALRDEHGQPVRMIGIVQDITDRRLLEDQLRQAQKMEAIGRLAGGIAHDLNNALTAVAGYAELALGQLEESNPVRDDVEEIRRGAERATSVTRQLLAFSRKELLEPRLFDLNKTITTLSRLLGRLLGPDVQVSTNLAPSVPPILGDPGQFEQAIINLAVNARDAMPGGGTLTLTTSVEDMDAAAARSNTPMTPGRYVALRVADTGMGMTPSTLAHIFEPFFTTKGPGKGTGLGLSMVYGTLKQIGGFIFADSEIGHGTTFRLYLRPAAPPAGDQTAPPAVDAANGTSQFTILVAEDEPAVRSAVAAALRSDGHRLLLASSAEEAEELLRLHPNEIDLVVTDAIMPGKSGIDLARALTAAQRGLHVIVMSAYAQDVLTDADDTIDILAKPFTPRDLLQRVRQALPHPRETS
jgi:signal transduction histidine kinase